MMRYVDWAMDAATICRGLAVWALRLLKSSGCNVVDVPDKAPWQEACQKVISENTSDQAELYQQLLDMKA